MREAAIRDTPLTVLTVHPAISGFYGGVATYPGDLDLTEQAREAAQAETDKVLAGLDGPHPESVTVSAVRGFVVEEIIKAASDADMVVVGSRGAGGFAADDGIHLFPGRPARAVPGHDNPARGR